MLSWKKKSTVKLNQPKVESKIKVEEGVNIFEIWREYENIAMHFNDLIIQLRVRALGGIAAISAIVGFISKENSSEIFRWGILAGVFFLLIIIWIAIWAIDFLYYNRLLVGAVYAIKELEDRSKLEQKVKYINMSTRIEESVRGQLPKDLGGPKRKTIVSGRMLFYPLVLVALLIAFALSFYKYCKNSTPSSLGQELKVCCFYDLYEEDKVSKSYK